MFDYLRLNEDADRPTAIIFDRPMDPPRLLMSRLLAKMALEMLAFRLLPDLATLQSVIDLDHWKPLRRWARIGDNFNDWPYFYRQVFPEETLMRHPDTNNWVQAGYSIDLFITRRRETYLAFLLYGHEFVFNTGGPSIKGYEEWLDQQGHISPLIERLGLHLHTDMNDRLPSTYLYGEAAAGAGFAFDWKHGIAGITEGG